MGWVTMTLRKAELKASISDRTLRIMQLERELRRLTSFASSAADGIVSPNEIASLGLDLFGDALDFMGYGSDAAAEIAQEQTDMYMNAYEGITAEQYYNNPQLSAQAQLYFDEDGNLNEETIYAKFYEQALKEYAEECILPALNEKEKEIEQEKLDEETLLQTEEAELKSLDQSISSEIQNNAPKYP